MKIANIVTTASIDVPDDFNIVNSMDKRILGIPTLIVGYEYVKKNYPDFDVTNIKLADDLYWTVKRTEKRDKYQEDVNWFVVEQYKNIIRDVKYVFVDLLQYHPKTMFKITRKLLSSNNIVTYHYLNMVYMSSDKIIFGVDLNLVKFVGLDPKKVLSKIRQISSVLIEDDKTIIPYKKRIEFLEKQVKLIPFLYSIENPPI